MKAIHHVAIAAAGFLLLASPALAMEDLSDANVTAWVKQAISDDPIVATPSVTVTTKNGIVTLGGRVKAIAQRDRAGAQAKKIRGVRGLVNEIVVAPAFRSDATIVQDVRRRILNDAVIVSQGIRVTSKAGDVTLHGQVSTWSEAEQAALVASEVLGVKSVANDLTTRYESKRSDQEIKNDAVAALGRDIYLARLPITTAVSSGVVTLSGKVGTLRQKERAVRTVRWLENVKSVKDELVVDPLQKRGEREDGERASDSEIRAAVRESLRQDPRVDDAKIQIQVAYGGVTLKGSVFDHYERVLAERDARDVVGVGWVTNELFAEVDRRDDWAVEDDVVFGIQTDWSLRDRPIEATVEEGVVTLKGKVPSWYERSRAATVAGRVRGVVRVMNEIEVEWKPPETQEAHANAEVAKRVRENFGWHWTTYWVSDRIHVSVANGVATLTGSVDTWAQRREAGRVAFETPGVWKVVNRLHVAAYDYEWDDEYGPDFYYDDPWW